MFAVVKSGGKQQKVEKGDVITVERMTGEVGASVELGPVLMAGGGKKGVQAGTPELAGVKVTAEILSHGKGRKITIIKSRRRKHSREKMGHRQLLTSLKITDIKETRKTGGGLKDGS
ncbi:MAG: 50S ribosomal protein L21 [Candidatus Nitrospinota bacterium M3_3B_026]